MAMPPLLILTMAMLFMFSADCVMSLKICPNCGRIPVPYPLSTGPDCGDPWYKVRCNAGTLWLDAMNKSSYMITSINPMSQTLIIRPPGFAKNTCMAADFGSGGVFLDSNLPFNITSTNTVMIMNCSALVLTEYAALNCSSTSICHDYIKGNPEAKANCGTLPYCCWFVTGGTMHAYRIHVRPERCSAYQSFVNLDMNLPVNKWPQPGLELEWVPPVEPKCKLPVDCGGLLNSMCLPDPVNVGQRRCLCKSGFQWDPIHGICQDLKCKHGKSCKHKKNKTSMLGGAAMAAGAIVIGLIVTIIIVYKQRKHCEREAEVSLTKAHIDLLSSNSGKLAKFFTSKEIAKATNNFSEDNLLGSGGFGEVFKGILDDGTNIAVKRAKLGNTKGIDQIINEVRILCQVNHRNLVKLLGCCVELDQPILIYEFIPNGTLFDHLHRTTSGNVIQLHPLSWQRRLCIAYQTAQGLAYLHSSVVPPIYHRDIKSSNILLDENLDAKVADFGLSRLGLSSASHVTTCVQGTLGYLDPEYYLNFQLTDKSDVYSFGVVLMELLTCKKAIDFNRDEEDVNLVVFSRRFLKEEKFMDVIDPFLIQAAGKAELETMKALAILAGSCLNEKRQNRPSMRTAVKEIENCAAAIVHCSNCGKIPVPYPLSTDPNCGDQAYKIRCTAGVLWFDALKGSYMIVSINPLTQRMILRPPGLTVNACISSDITTQGIQLDEKRPFNITSSNTIFLLNCIDTMLHLQPPIDCAPTSLCHNYIKDNAAVCIKAPPLCCMFKPGGLQSAYVVRVHEKGCLAYQSFVNLDSVHPPKKWPEPGLELAWALPKEPVCNMPTDCKSLLHSKCLADPMRIKRCLCHKGFMWDPINGLCQSAKCPPGKRCKKPKKKAVLICGVAAALGGVSLAIMAGILVYKQRIRQSVKKEVHKNIIKERHEILNAKNHGKSARIFTGKEITKATDNFSSANLIGSGGFGEVFKGVFDDGTITAIKRAKLGNTKGTDQVLNEVRILCQVNHRSLVRLLGCCVELDQPLMIYEFIPNGTLFEHLHSKKAIDFNREEENVNLVVYMKTMMDEDRLMDAVDPVIKEGASNLQLETIKAFGLLAGSCLDEKRQNRPSMKQVADEIEYIINIAKGEVVSEV
ncbi:hypothetical protein COLO4_14742 [Corchorus olitorius]|uniref:Protein kinase domain-containing protein n=1 Tax=Corchorus olitorius TaxID=93759 RepID=A0A1R3JR35_9ROSI|nr:hypothetical protein COLO4_14742 [Corchorus olitorius]